MLAAGAAIWIGSMPRPAVAAGGAALPDAGDPERGRLVFLAGDCASCHASPGQEDRLRLGGGMALGSPYGVFRVPNISPDPDHGIGSWSDEDLANALLSGVSPDGRHYYPVFPYPSYTHMRLRDVRDLRAYLRTLPPVAGTPHKHEIVFPFTIRRLIGLWKLAFLDRGTIEPEPGRGATWNRGRYLVEAVAHCAECHSSRNVAGAIRENTRFAGGRDPEGLGFAPNITPAGIGDWSEADLVEMLTSGRTPAGTFVGSTMADVVQNTAELPRDDRVAIAAYIRGLPPRPTPVP
jgi:mono/diheme cytochrome c family protein